MKRTHVFPTILLATGLVVLLVGLTGCASSEKAAPAAVSSAGADSTLLHTKEVHVLVDGKDKGVLPKTLRVRRSFGTQMVSLYQSGEEIRTYEIMIDHTTEGVQLQQSFFGTSGTDSKVYDVTTLPTDGEDEYRIPYSPYRITVEDRQYNLVLIVED